MDTFKVLFGIAVVGLLSLITFSVLTGSPKTAQNHSFGDIISGQSTYTISSTTNVTSSDTLVQATTTSRQYCRYTNIGVATIFLAFMGDAQAVSGNGIALVASSTFQMTNADLSLYRGAIHAITATPSILTWSCI